VRRSIIRCAAATCIVAGCVLTNGVGAVAVADDTSGPGNQGSGGIGPTPAVDSSTTGTGANQQDWPGLRWLRNLKPPRVGPVRPPAMNLPPRLTQIENGGDGNAARLTVPREVQISSSVSDQNGPQPQTGVLGVPDTQNQEPRAASSEGGNGTSATTATAEPAAPPGPQGASSATLPSPGPESPRGPGDPPTANSPALDLTKLVPPGVPLGTPITIKNPLLYLIHADLQQPLLPQVLPSPLVVLLSTLSEQSHLANMLIGPALSFIVPREIVDTLFASNIVLPTFDLGSLTPAVPRLSTSVTTRPVRVASAPNRPPPAEIAPMGMDVVEAPVQAPASPLATDVEPPQQFTSPSVPMGTDDISAQSNQLADYRAGYSDYLRNAGIAQITAIAVPGAVAILLFAVFGGFLGYRQARAGHVIRTEGIGRFLR
jgi:hypothetical protein